MSIHLFSFAVAVYLVNVGRFLSGIVVGVVGIVLVRYLTRILIWIEARVMAGAEIDDYDLEKEREYSRVATR